MSADRTLRDLIANEEARKDARRELHLALDGGDEADRATWVADWGEAVSDLLAKAMD